MYKELVDVKSIQQQVGWFSWWQERSISEWTYYETDDHGYKECKSKELVQLWFG